jgi:hypothetical protein
MGTADHVAPLRHLDHVRAIDVITILLTNLIECYRPNVRQCWHVPVESYTNSSRPCLFTR